MYSAKVIARAVASYESKAGHSLIEVPRDKVEDWIAHLTSLWDPEEGSLRRPLRDEEAKFIRNERVMSMLSFRYWAERYGTLGRDGGGLCKFTHPWGSQEIIVRFFAALEDEMHDAIAQGSAVPYIIPGDDRPAVNGMLVAIHKARQLGACLGRGTRVLTADLRWVPIETVTPGMQMVALDEFPPGGKGIARKMRTATVLNRLEMEVPTYRLVVDAATSFIATPHHKFLCQDRGGHICEWREVQHMKPGDRIRRVVQPWTDGSTYEDGWFGGFLDGEGSLRHKKTGGAELCGAQVQGVVLERAITYLKAEQYGFRFDIDRRDPETSSKFGSKEVYKVVIARMHDIFRLVGKTRSARFICKHWWEGKELPNSGGDSWATVTEVGPSSIMPVYDIETMTGTYVAEGLASHNTAVSRLMIMHRLLLQNNRRSMSASVDDDKIQELYDRDKLIYDNLPFYLQPQLKYDEKRQNIHFESTDSRSLYQVSSQKTGVGVGRQFDYHHMTELSSWTSPETLDLDFFPTIPRSINTLGIEESTARGRGDWWHRFTEKIRRGKEPRFRFLFIPVYAEESKYRSVPPVDWQPSEIALLYAQKVWETSQATIGRQVMVSKNHLHWWESTRESHREDNRLAIFYTSYCATVEESFQHAGDPPFPYELLEGLRLRTRPGVPFRMVPIGTE